MDLVIELLPVDGDPASSSGRGISPLDHKVSNDSVELCVVVVASSRKFGEVSASHRRMFPVQLNDKFAHSEKRR